MQGKAGRLFVLFGFVQAAAILAFAGWQAYRNTTQFAMAAIWQSSTYEILVSLNETLAMLGEIEAAERAYVVTGDEGYLTSYREGIKNLDQTIGRLKDLTSGNPNQLKQMQALEPLIEKQIAATQEVVELRKSRGFDAAHRMLTKGQGTIWIMEIRAQMTEIADHEKELLKVRTREATEKRKTSASTILAGSCAGVFLLSVVFGLLNRELSERKRAQEALRKSEQWSSTTLGGIGEAVIATDTAGAVTFMNPVSQSLTGCTQKEAAGKSLDFVLVILDKESRCPAGDLVRKVLREGNVVELDDRTLLLSKGGTEHEIEGSAAPIQTETGESLGVVFVLRDLTPKKLADEEIRRQKELLELILNSVQDYAVFMLDSEGLVSTWNTGAERIKGYKQSEILGRHFSCFYPTSEASKPQELLEVAKKEGHVVSEGWRIRKDGSEFWAYTVLTALRDKQARLIGFSKITRDMTERKSVEEALVRSKEEAERTTKFKNQFLSTMSHELRTPLNAVLGFSDLLADERYGFLNDRQQRYVSHINAAGRHLLRLISDILDLSKIEAGRMDVTPEDVAVASAFGEVISALQPLAEKKSQTLLGQAAPDLCIRADPVRLKQVLMNLVGNAVKFTPKGGRIELTARRLDGKIRIEVRDNGPGIPAEEQHRVFEAFYRMAQAGSSPEGTGLGLTIAARLVAMHGDKLSVESLPGSGTRFYFSVPAVDLTSHQAFENTHASRQTNRANEDHAITSTGATEVNS